METSRTDDLTIDQVVERLGRDDRVVGILEIGASIGGALSPHSDFDLVIVMKDTPGAPHVGLTTVEGRLTDLIFVTAAEVDRILVAEQAIDPSNWTGRVLRWLGSGRIRHDPEGQLQKARDRGQSKELLAQPKQSQAYAAWFSLNYNLVQTRRMMASSNPVYRAAAECRMAWHGTADLLGGYLAIRDHTWSGEKDALRYLDVVDPDFLAKLRRFLTEPDAERRLACYEQLVASAAEPIGPLWPRSFTVFMPADSSESVEECVDAAHALWNDMIRQSSSIDL